MTEDTSDQQLSESRRKDRSAASTRQLPVSRLAPSQESDLVPPLSRLNNLSLLSLMALHFAAN